MLINMTIKLTLSVTIFAMTTAYSFTCPDIKSLTAISAPSGTEEKIGFTAPTTGQPSSLGGWKSIEFLSKPNHFDFNNYTLTSNAPTIQISSPQAFEKGVVCEYTSLSINGIGSSSIHLIPENVDKSEFKYPFTVQDDDITANPN